MTSNATWDVKLSNPSYFIAFIMKLFELLLDLDHKPACDWDDRPSCKNLSTHSTALEVCLFPHLPYLKTTDQPKLKLDGKIFIPIPWLKLLRRLVEPRPMCGTDFFLPEETIKNGSYSALQLQTINFCYQQHEWFLTDGSRSGFLIGDGACVGKKRVMAGIILGNDLQGRKRLFGSQSRVNLKSTSNVT